MPVLLNKGQTINGIQVPNGFVVFGLDKNTEDKLTQGGAGSPVNLAVLGDADAAAVKGMVSGAGKSTFGWQRVQRSQPNPPSKTIVAGAPKMIDNQVPAKGPYMGFRLVYMNLNTLAPANYTIARAGGAANHLVSTGAEISWDQQFMAGSAAIQVPNAKAATKAGHVIPAFKPIDWCWQMSVARSDFVSNGSKPLLRIRSRTADEDQYLWTLGGNANWNAWPGNGGMLYGSYVTSTDLVTAVPTDSATVLANGGVAQPSIVQFAYLEPHFQWISAGDSRRQGDGSSVTAGAIGLAGWPMIVHCQTSDIDVLDLSVSGQKTIDSLAILTEWLNSVTDDPPWGIAFTVLSPNDPLSTQADIDLVWTEVLKLHRIARPKGVRMLVETCAPVNSWTPAQHALCEQQNARALALASSSPYWVRVLDTAAIVRDPANPRQINPAWDVGDGVHWKDACHQAVGASAPAVMR